MEYKYRPQRRKPKAAQEKELYQRQISMSRGGSRRRGGDRSEFSNSQQVGPDGWAVAGGGSSAPRPPPKAGDLSNFGKISKTQPMTFGLSSVFAGKKGAENKRESISRTSSSSNMFSMLSSPTVKELRQVIKVSLNTEIRMLLFLTPLPDKVPAAVAEPLPQRKCLVLQPRSAPVDVASPPSASVSESESSPSLERTKHPSR
jgi:translation initiation factor 4G